MHNRERFYALGLSAAQPFTNALAGLHPKGASAVRGRRESAARFADWSREQRDRARPLILVHAPSVGESLMAQAIIAQIRVQRPDAQIAFTFFSPSAEKIAARTGADVYGYLPFDTRPAMRALVQQLAPNAVGFVRTEIWPILGIRAAAAGAGVVLVNAVLSESSSRLRPGARYMLGPAYRRLDAIGAVTKADAERFGLLGVPRERVVITGDARFDQVWSRVQGLDPNSPLLQLVTSGGRPVVVAGSTWPGDEAPLIEAYARMSAALRPRLVIAPHEPTDAALRSLETNLEQRKVTWTPLSSAESAGGSSADVIVVDRVGVLADLYAAAKIAYVGGGFGTKGLHSVVEPAALGIPVLYGPAHGNAREAGDLAAMGGGFVVRTATEIELKIGRLLQNATARQLAGTAAEDFVRSRLGGAAANAAILTSFLPD